MKTYLLLITLSLLTLSAKSQEYDKTWVVGLPMEPMTFETDTIVNTQFPDYLESFLTISNICDKQGNLLFFTNGINVYDRLGHIMQNGDSINYPSEYYDQVVTGGMPSREGAVILPEPGDSNVYYVFHYSGVDTFHSLGGYESLNFYYSKVDMSGGNGLGVVVEKNTPLIQDVLLSQSRLAACKHANGRDWWVIKNVWHDNIYYEFLLTPDGVQGPFIQQLGPAYGPVDEQVGYAQFSPDGAKYASVTSLSAIVLMDFDRCTGLLSNPVGLRNQIVASSIPHSGAVSLAFSPSGRYLYACDRLSINQYDMQGQRLNDSIRIVTFSNVLDTFQMDVMQLGPNGKIYVSCWNGGRNKLHVINSPDSLGLACDFREHQQEVTSINPIGIPYFPNYKLAALPGSCDTIHTDLTAIAEAHPSFATITPVPATDHATLLWYTAHATSGHAVLYDISGRIVWSAETHTHQGTLPIDTRALPSGTYLIHYDTDGKTLLDDKLIIAH